MPGGLDDSNPGNGTGLHCGAEGASGNTAGSMVFAIDSMLAD